jgi:prepilin-type N-terminal cleavage/methylation domain-containing protein
MKRLLEPSNPERALVRGRRRNQAGFTMSEVLVSLIVFTIAVVGLVAMESRGIEAQRASMELREGERIAQETMQDLMNTGFDQLVNQDFANNPLGNFPYDDVDLDTFWVVDYRGVPVEDPDNAVRPGVRKNFYWVGRRIDGFPATAQPQDPDTVDALQMDVTVLWIDYTNPAYPPPASETVDDLRPENLIAGDPDYKPWVSGVELRTVRVNDGAPGTPPPP